MGLLTLCICLPLLIIYKWRSVLNFKNVFIGVVVTAILLFFATIIFSDSFKRLKSISSFSTESVDKNSAESTAVRVLIWEQSLEVIKKNLVFGTGVGDANDELYRAYENNGLSGALRHKLNAHNQYLQTTIGMGLVGLALLVMINFGSLIYSIRKKHFLFFIFSILVILNFMVESMLQRSDGVLFFAFFYCFFYLVNESSLKDEVNAGLE
jgi:O-antigen ligase